jgi:hypothetical protein
MALTRGDQTAPRPRAVPVATAVTAWSDKGPTSGLNLNTARSAPTPDHAYQTRTTPPQPALRPADPPSRYDQVRLRLSYAILQRQGYPPDITQAREITEIALDALHLDNHRRACQGREIRPYELDTLRGLLTKLRCAAQRYGVAEGDLGV